MLDQAERLRQLAQDDNSKFKNKARIITITSGKGGVGKSNLVVNLAIQLNKRGYKVLVFDADIGMGNDDVLMGVYPRYNMYNVISDGLNIRQVIYKGPHGVDLLSGGSGLNNIEDLNEDDRTRFLNELESLDEYDYILMDTGAGINRSVLAFIACCDDLILVTTPEPTSLTDGYSLLKAVNHFKVKQNAGIVINKTFDETEGINTYYKFESVVNKFLDIKVNYLGQIEDDRKLVQSVRNQIPFSINYPNCMASRGVMNIADKIVGITKEKTGTGARGLFKKIFSIFS